MMLSTTQFRQAEPVGFPLRHLLVFEDSNT